MKRWGVLAISGLLTVGLGCASSSSSKRRDSKPSTAAYSCPMHPEVQETLPSHCWKCGMNLVRP